MKSKRIFTDLKYCILVILAWKSLGYPIPQTISIADTILNFWILYNLLIYYIYPTIGSPLLPIRRWRSLEIFRWSFFIKILALRLERYKKDFWIIGRVPKSFEIHAGYLAECVILNHKKLTVAICFVILYEKYHYALCGGNFEKIN